MVSTTWPSESPSPHTSEGHRTSGGCGLLPKTSRHGSFYASSIFIRTNDLEPQSHRVTIYSVKWKVTKQWQNDCDVDLLHLISFSGSVWQKATTASMRFLEKLDGTRKTAAYPETTKESQDIDANET